MATEPGGFSATTAQEYLQSGAVTELQAEVEKALAEKQADNTFQASVEAVRANLQTQLDAAGRFTPDVNAKYATLASSWYATLANKSGTTPEALYERYPLKIGAEGVGADRYDQVLYRGVGGDSGGSNYYTSDPEFARNFTRSGQDREIRVVDVPDEAIHTPAVLPEANKEEQVSAAIEEARAAGKSAVRVSEGDGQPSSVFVFDKAAVRSAGRYSGGKYFQDGAEQSGPFGPMLSGFKGDAKGAIAKLMEMQGGEALGALYHQDIGDIDLVWGREGTSASDGYGLAKLAKWHPEVVGNLQEILSSMQVVQRGKTRIRLESPDHRAAVSLEWFGNKKTWLLTAYERGGVAGTTMDTAGIGGEGDTARPTDASSQIVEQTIREFYQGDKARGAFDPATLTISLFDGTKDTKKANLSTFLHETGHFFLEVYADLASQPDAPLVVQQDMASLLQWFGVDSLDTWHGLDIEEKRSYHEQFARGFEAYLFEGKAPSIEVHGLFGRFRAWLLKVYKDLKALKVELTDEVRGVMDRMLASEEQIKLAEYGRSMLPLFRVAERAGMTLEEFSAYQSLGEEATANAVEQLQARGLRDMQWLHRARGNIAERYCPPRQIYRACSSYVDAYL